MLVFILFSTFARPFPLSLSIHVLFLLVQCLWKVLLMRIVPRFKWLHIVDYFFLCDMIIPYRFVKLHSLAVTHWKNVEKNTELTHLRSWKSFLTVVFPLGEKNKQTKILAVICFSAMVCECLDIFFNFTILKYSNKRRAGFFFYAFSSSVLLISFIAFLHYICN